MSYTSLDSLLRAFGTPMLVQLTDRGEVATGLIDADAVNQALANTDAVIDASLAARYRLPLASVPVAVADLALSIAIYKLHRVRPDEKIERDYQQALKDLSDFGAGRKLLDVAGVEPETSGASGVIAIDRARDMSPESLRGFI